MHILQLPYRRGTALVVRPLPGGALPGSARVSRPLPSGRDRRLGRCGADRGRYPLHRRWQPGAARSGSAGPAARGAATAVSASNRRGDAGGGSTAGDGRGSAGMAAAGFNRIGLGVQSLNDLELAAVGRRHRAHDVMVATERLRVAGFTNLSFDLIIGLPYQTEQSWEASLAGAIALRPEHISVYLLEVDEHSRLGREVLTGGRRYSAQALPTEEAMAEWYERASYQLEEAGYRQYEISNWARPGFASRHNLKYWLRIPYLGFGAGAHSFAGRQRWANREDPRRYIECIQSGRPAVQFVEQLGEMEVLEEELLLGLRRTEGIDLADLGRRYGDAVTRGLERLEQQGWLERWQGRLRIPSPRLTVANEVLAEVLRTCA